MIKLVNINKYYKNGLNSFHALKDINIAFGSQGMNFILGKSGSGKSTLLNVIGGIDDYDSGELYIDNLSTENFSAADYNNYRNTYIGFVFQEFNVLKGLNVYDNIALSLELHRENIKLNHERIQNIINEVGLSGLEHRMMNEISGGQKQRVAIARALIKNPKVIIADEPTGNLDKNNREMIMNLLKKLSDNRLVIIVTHDQLLAEAYGDRIIRIKDGEVIEDSASNSSQDVETLELKPVKTPYRTSFNLAQKSIRRNLSRFVLMILLFAFSLTFASVVVNIFLANSTLVYANYQKEYDNKYITLENRYQALGYDKNTGFYDSLLPGLFPDIENNDAGGLFYIKGMDYNINIRKDDAIPVDDVYVPFIQRIHKSDAIRDIFPFTSFRSGTYPDNIGNFETPSSIEVIITDYVADALLHYQYFGPDVTSAYGEDIDIDGFSVALHIVGIVKTDYQKFVERGLDRNNVYAAFMDNLAFYNGIFTTSSNINYLVKSVNYYYDDLLVNVSKNVTEINNVKFTVYNEDTDRSDISGSWAPSTPEPNEPIQMAVSTGFLKQALGFDTETPQEMFNYINYKFEGVDEAGQSKIIDVNSVFAIFGVRRAPVSTSFIVTDIVTCDEPIIYTREFDNNLPSYALGSYNNGSFLTIRITGDPEYNSSVYRQYLNDQYFISNMSFRKVVLVENFIQDNLYFLIGLFFVFGLFSILLIFNFIIINIKNSTRDIGIYMSLGMSGTKISLIYFFQVIIMGIVSFLVATFGTLVFILILDASFSAQAIVNLPILKITILGMIIILGIAIIIPNLAIILPLFSLSRKRPVDVIKIS